MNTSTNEVAITGVGLHPFGRFEGKSAMAMAADAIQLALTDAGVESLPGLAEHRLTPIAAGLGGLELLLGVEELPLRGRFLFVDRLFLLEDGPSVSLLGSDSPLSSVGIRYDVVLIARPAALEVAFADLVAEAEQAALRLSKLT